MDLEKLRYYTRWVEHVNERTYEAPADPWKLLRVSPMDVEYFNNEVRLGALGRVKGGQWDRAENCRPVDETRVVKGLRQRFEEGYDWEETVLYRKAKERFDSGEPVRYYESIDEFRDIRLGYVDELFERIKTDGYRPNERAGHVAADDDNPFEDAYAHHLEPLVVIGRSGDIYWTEGYHRLAIASILELDWIPVYVLARHERWQAIRDELATTPPGERSSALDAYRGHPDLREFAR